MPWRLLVLDNDPVRLGAFDGHIHALGDWRLKAWTSAEEMTAKLDENLPAAHFISLDAGLAPPVVEHLAGRKPTCPITIHWRHTTSATAWKAIKRLSAAGWDVGEVGYMSPGSERSSGLGQWLRSWQRTMHELLLDRSDTKANRIHAANCERLRAQFEGREAIYLQPYARRVPIDARRVGLYPGHYVRRIRVVHIRANVDKRRMRAMVEEILTPGLGAPTVAGMDTWWPLDFGYPTRFSSGSWTFSETELYFAPDLIDAVLAFAATLPSEEVYGNERLLRLIWERGGEYVRSEQRVFPS
jgi:hypothetical protein